MRRSGTGLVVGCVLSLIAACGAPTSGVPEPDDSPSTATPAGYTLAELHGALPTAEDLPRGYRVGVTCQAPSDPACDVEGLPDAQYAVFTASRGEGTRGWGLRDTIYLTAGSFASPAEAAAVVAEAEQRTRRDLTGRIDLGGGTDGDTGVVPGEKGTGAIEPFSLGDWRGTLATRTTRLTDGGERVSPPGTYATITVASGRVMLSVSTVTWSGRAGTEESTEQVRSLLEEYLARLGS